MNRVPEAVRPNVIAQTVVAIPILIVAAGVVVYLRERLSAAVAALADEARRDLATAVTSVLSAQAGAWAVRVHDVAGTRDALTVARSWQEGNRWTSSTRSWHP